MSEHEEIDTAAGRAMLRRTGRKTLAISVLPDGSVELTAPESAPLPEILRRVEKRLTWIRRQQREFAAMNAVRPRPRYVTGATHRYLGRQYRLKLSPGPASVALRGGWLHVSTPEPADASVAAALREWYRKRAKEQFTRRLAAWEGWCAARKLPIPVPGLRAMPKRWGSALPDGRILLNPDLIKAPSACVDYVITHEICHLRHPNHGPAFQRMLTQLCPDWRRLKERLERAEM